MKLECKLRFDTIFNSDNLVSKLSDKDKLAIVSSCLEGYQIDQQSRYEWDKIYKEVLKIAKQESCTKTTPYKESANVKLPLLTTAALQFASRAYPEFIKNGRVVNCAIMGQDSNGDNAMAAKRVSDHMSYQLLIESPTWEKNFDKSLAVLPISGTVFKKTYYDSIKKTPCSDLCLPDHIAINQSVDDLLTAQRITHLMYMSKNEIVEQIRFGNFDDISDTFETVKTTNSMYLPESEQERYNPRDESNARPIIEQHRFLDLDGDGYEEPYIVTIDLSSEQLLRIYRRFDGDGILPDKNGDIARIEPVHYFTDYHFCPAPDGTFWSMGYGQLLYPLNHVANSLTNQIIDTGRRNASPCGFISKLFKTVHGKINLEPDEFKVVDQIMSGKLSDHIMPIPPAQVSPVLFQTLNMMIDQSKNLASNTDMLQGNQEGQNMPATTAMALVEQGLKVYSSIIKRQFRSLKSELEKIYRLNALYLDDTVYFNLLNDESLPTSIRREDYSLMKHTVYPVADPALSSDAQRLARANAIFQAAPHLSPEGQDVAKRIYFEALQVPDSQIDALLQQSSSPNPEMMKLSAEAQLLNARAQTEAAGAQLDAKRLELDAKDRDIKQQLADLKAMQVIHSAEKADAKAELDRQKAENEQKLADAELYVAALKSVDPEKGLSLETVKSVIKQQEEDSNKP